MQLYGVSSVINLISFLFINWKWFLVTYLRQCAYDITFLWFTEKNTGTEWNFVHCVNACLKAFGSWAISGCGEAPHSAKFVCQNRNMLTLKYKAWFWLCIDLQICFFINVPKKHVNHDTEVTYEAHTKQNKNNPMKSEKKEKEKNFHQCQSYIDHHMRVWVVT